MAKMKQHKQVGEEFLATAKQASAVHFFPFPAVVVWKALLDGPTWTEWLPLTDVTWTSPEPFGVGTTRTVEMSGQKIEETFFAWEDGRRMAFRFERSTLPVSAGVEDYQVVPVEGGCELRWTGKASGLFPVAQLLSFGLRKGLQDGMPKLEALIKADPARFGVC